MKFLVDNNVISESIKTKPNSGVIEFLHAIESENLSSAF